uniref:Uncharacterized protein n=1 Tax=Moniliophthora roreri TaxID=221103 RepID=A0A0W0EWR2_MONRR
MVLEDRKGDSGLHGASMSTVNPNPARFLIFSKIGQTIPGITVSYIVKAESFHYASTFLFVYSLPLHVFDSGQIATISPADVSFGIPIRLAVDCAFTSWVVSLPIQGVSRQNAAVICLPFRNQTSTSPDVTSIPFRHKRIFPIAIVE